MASTRSEGYITDDADKKMDMSSGPGNSVKPVSAITNGEPTREKDDTALRSALRSAKAVDARGGRSPEQQQQQLNELRSANQSSEKPSSAAVSSSVSSSVSQPEEKRLSFPTVGSFTAAATTTPPRTQAAAPPPPPPVPAEESLSLSLSSTGIKESKGRGGDAAALFGREHTSSFSSLPSRSGGAAGCADGNDDDDAAPVAFKTRGLVGAMTSNFPSSSSAEKAEIVRRKELRAAFDRFDKNRDGKITKEELGDVLKVVGDEATDEELTFMIKEVDKNGDGVIDWDEFVLLNTVDAGQRERELRAAFRVFDRDDNGYITVRELYEVLRNLDDDQGTITEQEVERMIARVDSDGDGYVNYVEFKRMMEIEIDPSS